MHVRVSDLFVILVLKRCFFTTSDAYVSTCILCLSYSYLHITCVNHISSMFNSDLSYILFIF